MVKKKKGATIIETIITMGIFALIMTAICAVFQKGFSFYHEGSGNVYAFQHAVIALDRMSRDLQDNTTLELYYPDLETLYKGTQAIVFVKEFPEEETSEVIGYVLDEEKGEIARVIYNPGYDPEMPSTQTEKAEPGTRKVLAQDIRGMAFQAEGKGLLSIWLAIKGTHTGRYLRTKIRNEALTQ